MRNLVFLLSLAVATVCGSHISSSPRADSTLAKYLLNRQVQLRSADATTSAQCFIIYLPLLSQVADQWQQDYENCLNVASENRTEVLQQKGAEQEDMSKSADNVNQYIKTCQSINASLEFFDCFASLSQNVLSSVYTISNNASDLAADLVEQLNVIDLSMYKCTNSSERAYVEQTADIYEALDYCLQYGPPPTAPPAVSSSSSTTASSLINADSNAFVAPEEVLQRKAASPRTESRRYVALKNWLQNQIDTPRQ